MRETLVLLYNKERPEEIKVVYTLRDLYTSYREGYKKVPPHLVARRIKAYRKKLGLSQAEMREFLEDHGLHVSDYSYRKLESGNASYETITTTFLTRLAKIMYVEPKALYTSRETPKVKVNKRALKTFIDGVRYNDYIIELRSEDTIDCTAFVRARTDKEARQFIKHDLPGYKIVRSTESTPRAGVLTCYETDHELLQ